MTPVGKYVQGQPNGGVTMGPDGDACNQQIKSGPGSDKPMRTKKINPAGGYTVTGGPVAGAGMGLNEPLETRP